MMERDDEGQQHKLNFLFFKMEGGDDRMKAVNFNFSYNGGDDRKLLQMKLKDKGFYF